VGIKKNCLLKLTQNQPAPPVAPPPADPVEAPLLLPDALLNEELLVAANVARADAAVAGVCVEPWRV